MIRDIVFHMENRDGEFCFDTGRGAVAEAGEPGGPASDGDGRFVPLPSWSPADGFRLMETFAATGGNAETRGRLRAALEKGKGVFRAFKDTLAASPAAERRWRLFRERQLRRRVREWYGDLLELWGLERLAAEPDEMEELLREDFVFRPGREEDFGAAAALHGSCRAETGFLMPPRLESPPFRILLAVESTAGECAGFAALAEEEGGTRLIVEVENAFRGCGLGEALLERSLSEISARPGKPLLAELPWESSSFSQALLRQGFHPAATLYVRDFSV